MNKPKSNASLNASRGHRGTGFAGPLVVPPRGGSAAGDAGGSR
jgi:hypothetical protein